MVKFTSSPSMTSTTATHIPISATGYLSLLSEPSPAIQQYALQNLLSVVDTLWHEIAIALPELEALSESDSKSTTTTTRSTTFSSATRTCPNTKTRQYAAAVASRVFFHLEEPFQALRLAMESGCEFWNAFLNQEKKSSSSSSGDTTTRMTPKKNQAYFDCLMGAAMDAYIALTREQENDETGEEEDKEEWAGEEEKGPEEFMKKQQEEKKTSSSSWTLGWKAKIDPTLLATLDPIKLKYLIQVLFQLSYEDGSYKYALGVAMEAQDISLLLNILDECQKRCQIQQTSLYYEVLTYTMNIVYSSSSSSSSLTSSSLDDHRTTSFRNSVLEIVSQHLKSLFESITSSVEITTSTSTLRKIRMRCILHYIRIQQLLQRARPVSNILNFLILGTNQDQGHTSDDTHNTNKEQDLLLAMQICFDLMDTGDQNYVHAVAKYFMESLQTTSQKTLPNDTALRSKVDKIQRILVGGFSSELSLSFLHKYSDSDRLIMDHLKKTLEERGGRNSVYHNCAIVTHSYLNAGTTNDSFLRDNLDWMKKASNWAKFSVTASLGVIHARHITEAMSILQPYLPPPPNETDPLSPVAATGGFAEGGSLYALGIIHGCDAGSCSTLRKETNDFLRNHLRRSHANEPISHGAALGVGLTAMGSCKLDIIRELKEVLYTDSAVAGEAAGYALGLVMVGSGAGNLTSSNNDVSANDTKFSEEDGVDHDNKDMELSDLVGELKNYAKETQHEKIIRGIAMALALINFGQEDNADATIDEMKGDRDPIMRYGAQYAIGLAYCGTGSNKAVRSLLHAAVSDVNDDVRAAAVIALAFVLYKTPERVPQLVKLLLESFNPHVRYASCMAVGLAMAGTGDSESISLLEPMLSDMSDFVRQGALLGTSMIYMQQGDSCNGKKVLSFREKLSTIVGDKHQTLLTKMGAILGTGIIDAGGRNCLLDMGSRHGFTKMTSVVGVTLWLQYWHWFPMMHMISLALSPTVTIALNKDVKFPKKFQIQCNSKPSSFAYPKRLEEKKEEKKKRVETVTLSTTAKNKARLARKRAKEDGTMMTGVDQPHIEKDEKDEVVEKMEVEEGDAVTVAGKKKRDTEPGTFRLSNPCRITKAQVEFCSFDLSQRYRPIRPDEKPFGVIMITDILPNESDDEVGTVLAPSMGAEDEADPPEPFEWTPPDYVERS